ncbi:hypothetical protein [Neobacillus sp. 204]|uniref:hypothetical protein n=1 Tax=Neobacillus sp. 204 TaxID=3383351 RepID=UPI00397D50DC
MDVITFEMLFGYVEGNPTYEAVWGILIYFFIPWYGTNLERGRIEVRRRLVNGYIRSFVLDA